MSSDESSSEEDVPLAALKNDKSKGNGNHNQRRRSATNAVSSYKEDSEEEEEYEFQSDDNQGGNAKEEYDDDDDGEEEEDDDKPIASLKKKKSGEKTTAVKKANTKAKPSKSKDAQKTKKKKIAVVSESNLSSTSSKIASSTIATAASELYSKSTKGKLISELLCRWWYAFSWPDASVFDTVPPNCDTLDGFPGVFVVTSGDEIGKIIDKRDPSTCPCFSNMVRKTSEELKELLLKAVENQTSILVQHEGKGTLVEKDLDALKKWALKVNPKKADKEAEQVLKAANLKY
jgi:hypothetical protein